MTADERQAIDELRRELPAVAAIAERWVEGRRRCALGLRAAAECLRRDVGARERSRLADALEATASDLEARP